MPINQSMFEALQPGVNQLNQQDAESKLTKLKAYLAPITAGQERAAKNKEDLNTLQSPQFQNQLNQGGVAKAGDLMVGADPYARTQMQGPHEAKTFQGVADKAFKPINDILDASKSTLDNLNLGNATGDQLAMINEAKLSLAGSGGRAIGQMVAHLSGDPTMAQSGQKALNWLQNTPNIPTLQPGQRDAMRESVFNRLDQTEQQGTQAASQLAQQGPSLAPHTDYNSLLGSYVTPSTQKLQALRKMQSDYQSQRQKMQPQPNVSNPSQASPNPTTLDRLKSFFSPGGGKPQQLSPGPAQEQDPIAAELAKRAQQSLGQPGQGQ